MRWRSALLVVLGVLAVLSGRAAFAVRLDKAPERPKWVAREILVGFNDRGTECAEARFRLGGSLRSPSLDNLLRRFGVREVRAGCRTAEGRPTPLAELRRQEQEAERRVREALPDRARRAGSLLKTAETGPHLFHVYSL